MASGKDVAKFVSQATGADFVGLYDDAEEYDNGLKTEAKKRFSNLVERMIRVDNNNKRDFID